jgi:hypothetical protein
MGKGQTVRNRLIDFRTLDRIPNDAGVRVPATPGKEATLVAARAVLNAPQNDGDWERLGRRRA